MAAEDRRHGENGQVLMDPAGGSALVLVASMNKWELDLSRENARVTAFGDANHVYVRSKPDIKGSYGGWWDSSDLTLFAAAFADDPVTLRLVPSDLEPTLYFQGKSYLDVKISVDVNGAIGISGGIVAAASWILPS